MTDTSYTFDEIQEKLDYMIDGCSYACGCLGPQRDEPECPCAMRSIILWRGQWLRLTPVPGRKVGRAFTSTGSQFEYDVILTGYQSKIHAIKVVREITKLGLADAKKLVERSDLSPIAVKNGVSLDEAHYIRDKLEEVGAKIEIR